MSKISLFISGLFLSFSLSCATAKSESHLYVYPENLKNGDLVFVKAKAAHLSGAINRVTQQTAKPGFDHIGLIEVTDQTVFVLHASTKLGSDREKLFDFYSKNKANQQQMIVYRLHEAYQHTTAEAVQEAKTMLNKAYNFSYILNDETYYCSDFIERAFRIDAMGSSVIGGTSNGSIQNAIHSVTNTGQFIYPNTTTDSSNLFNLLYSR